MSNRFEGKIVYISGGTSGIGLAAAELFAALGADVFVFSVDDPERRAAAVESIKRKYTKDKQRVESAVLDVTDEENVRTVLGNAATTFGPPFVLINSAGIGGAVFFEKLSSERFDRTMKINLYGTRHTILALLPFMKKSGGYIVNVSSMSGLIGLVGYTAYASSKFAVVGFSQSLRAELKPYGINVSVLCPPQVDTPLLRRTDKDKPPETKAINDRAGVMQAEDVVREMLDAMGKNKFLIIPGRKARMFHLLQRLLPDVRERMTERVIEKVRKAAGGSGAKR